MTFPGRELCAAAYYLSKVVATGERDASSWLNSQNMTDSKEAVPRPGGRFQPEMEIFAINF
jgi:hypothetical protein